MNLRFLRTFVAIADNAGFARAAERLHLTQSAASRQIQALEDELGLRLFARAGRSVRLTSEGEDLLIRSRRLLFDADAIGQRASALKTGEVGVLRVGATPQVIENLLADFLSRYRKRHAGVEVHLVEDGGSRLPGRLERGEVDVAQMPAGEDRFSGRYALSDARSGRVAAGPPAEPSCCARRDGACRRTVAASQLKLRVAWLVRGRLPCRAHSAAHAARKRRAADADRNGPGWPRYCRGSISGTDSPRRCPGGGVGASRSVDRTMGCRCLGLAALLATLRCAIRRRAGRPLPARLSGRRIRSVAHRRYRGQERQSANRHSMSEMSAADILDPC